MAMLVAFAAGMVAQAFANVCPVMMVSGAGERDEIAVTFRNAGKLPIRRLEFKCIGSSGRVGVCREGNALFSPGMEYTVRYPYPAGKRDVVTVAVESVTTADGFVWKAWKKLGCRRLRIAPPKGK